MLIVLTVAAGAALAVIVYNHVRDHDPELAATGRTRAELEAARARGRVGGRPTFGTEDKQRAAEAIRASGDYDVRVRARGHFPTEQAALKCLYPVTRSLDPTGRGRSRCLSDHLRRTTVPSWTL